MSIRVNFKHLDRYDEVNFGMELARVKARVRAGHRQSDDSIGMDWLEWYRFMETLARLGIV